MITRTLFTETVPFEEGGNVTFPESLLSPDSWNMGNSVVDAIIRDNTQPVSQE